MSKIIKFKTTYPTAKCMDNIINELKDVSHVEHITGEFINEVPRHNLIIMVIEDDTSNETIFELGRLVQIFDKN